MISLFITLILTSFLSIKTKTYVIHSKSQVEDITNGLTTTVYNQYLIDGNNSVLLALDSNLLGEGKYFTNETIAQRSFKIMLRPFENRFNLTIHISNVIPFTPGKNDNLSISIEKVPEKISWKLAAGVDAENVEGNGYDWLIIYQENYLGGRNQVNALYGNTLIIAHNQLVFDRQLILLHEIGHLFGGAHDSEGKVNPNWYEGEQYSIMDYSDLLELEDIWDGKSLPLDKHNFDTINSTRYRFDLKDPELDGLPNYYEYRYGFNPTINDSYNDYDNDGLTNLEEYLYGTNPIDKDSDGDNFSDWAEKYLGSSPINSSEVPVVDIPVIRPWMNQRQFDEKESFKLVWRGVSSNRNYLKIYQNNSLLVHSSWESELIEFQPEDLNPGYWNFTCLVVDMDGDKSASVIMIQIRKINSTSLFLLGPVLAFLCLSVIIKKKKK